MGHLGVLGQQCLINPLTNLHQPKSLINLINPHVWTQIPHRAACKGQDWPWTLPVSLIPTQGCLTDASTNTFSLQATYLWQGSPFRGGLQWLRALSLQILGWAQLFQAGRWDTAHLVTCCLNSLCCCLYRIPSLPPQPWGLENHLPLPINN